MPSERLVEIIADIFQKDVSWFLDENPRGRADRDAIAHRRHRRHAARAGIPVFVRDAADGSAGITGPDRHNRKAVCTPAHPRHIRSPTTIVFPTSSEPRKVSGKKQFPLSTEDVKRMAESVGLEIRWFDRPAFRDKDEALQPLESLVRSFYRAPNIVFMNNALKENPARLKIRTGQPHCAQDPARRRRRPRATDIRRPGHRQAARRGIAEHGRQGHPVRLGAISSAVTSRPPSWDRKRRSGSFLAKEAYAIDSGDKVELSTALIMRRMPSVSPTPTGTTSTPTHPETCAPSIAAMAFRCRGAICAWCPTPASTGRYSACSARDQRSPPRRFPCCETATTSGWYCCESIRGKDAAGNWHVMCAGIDLAPALHKLKGSMRAR